MFKNFYNTLISNNGLRATFIVVFVATMLTVYELSMFYFVVVPNVNSQIKKGILDISENLKKTDLFNSEKDDEFISDLNKIYGNIRSYDKLNNFSYIFDFIDKHKNKVNNLLNTDNKLYESKINTFKSVFETFQERENVLIDKINMYTVYTAFFMLIFLSILLLIIKNKLNERGENIGKCVWILSFITLFLIGIFQYAFYIFGNKYNYLGSEGQEELLYYLLSKLK
jgi:hypothetical protein